MNPAAKRKLIAVILLFVMAIIMQFIVVGKDETMIWGSIAGMAVVAGYLFKVC